MDEILNDRGKTGTCTKKYTYFLIPGLFLAFIAVGYLILNLVAAFSVIGKINHRYMPAEGEVPMPLEIAFLESRYQVSRLDSVSLVMDLTQGIATLEMAGVVVFTAPLRDVQVSPVIKRLKSESLANLVATPDTIVYWHSTAEKEPITVRQAPATPEEAEAVEFPRHGENMHEAFFSLDLESGLRVVFTHDAERTSRKTLWLAGEKARTLVQNLGRIFSGQLPEFTPTISVEVTAQDALVIFRALPNKGLVVLNPGL